MPRPGYITPSTFSDLMSKGRGGEEFGKTALRVIDNLVLDLLGVEKQESESTPASCQWGLDHEWEAIQLYQDRTFRHVQHPVEFRVSPSHKYVGGTMDGLVGDHGGIEVKSPFSSIEHLYNLREARQLYDLYWYQVQGYFWIFELEWIDFVSYDIRFPPPDDLFVKRVTPEIETIQKLQDRCSLAYEMALARVDEIRRGHG